MKKSIFSIPAPLPFADTLAMWILERYGADPLLLPQTLVLLPSRRACLSLREAFLRATGGRPTLLPRMQPLGDVEEDMLLALPGAGEIADGNAPHPAFASKRLFLLAHLVRAFRQRITGKNERMDHAAMQARDIASLLDRVEREGASLAELTSLAPDDFSAHWQLTTEFMAILGEHWPEIARKEQLTSPEEWRARLLRSLAERWKATPPGYPVIAAGSTGSVSATAELLKVITTLPQGSVILPGLDKQAGNDYMQHVTESHPQWGLRELLAALEVDRADVLDLAEATLHGTARSAFLSRALCPAEVMQEWREPFNHCDEAVEGLSFAPMADEQEEGVAVALMLREALESPGKTAALITHDRTLARRVAAEMQRYDVQIDDSAGQELAEMPAAAFLRLLLEVVESDIDPVKLLSLLKHPLAHAGMERIACLEAARDLEKTVLRGVCPAYGFLGLIGAVKNAKDAPHTLLPFLETLSSMLQPLLTLFAQGGSEAFSAVLEAHLASAESLAGEKLWQGREAEALATFIAELRDAAGEAGSIELSSYPALFDALLAGKAVRPDYGMHPRLKILSPLEARMQSFDRIIIGGLNEGSWPPQVGGDPWFNRPMRAAIGLAMPERQTGQAAHDFMMLAAAPEVIITRPEKTGGSPAIPARWWVRLMALSAHCKVMEKVMQHRYAHWARELDAAEQVVPCARPEPVPPMPARPSEVAITQVESWIADPYAFYAANILKLRKLPAIDEDPTAADFGISVHKALQRFAENYPAQLPPDALEKLLARGRDAFARYTDYYPVVDAWWWPRFEQVAQWVIEQEKILRPDMFRVWAEVKGEYELGGIKFIGRADRIEEARQGLAIVDYKTGGAVSAKDTREGNAVQLMLLALMAQEGKWNADIKGRDVTRLEYWIAGGGRNSGEVRPVDETQIADYARLARQRLITLVAQYANPSQPYRAPVSSARPDYEHLARVAEWR